MGNIAGECEAQLCEKQRAVVEVEIFEEEIVTKKARLVRSKLMWRVSTRSGLCVEVCDRPSRRRVWSGFVW